MSRHRGRNVVAIAAVMLTAAGRPPASSQFRDVSVAVRASIATLLKAPETEIPAVSRDEVAELRGLYASGAAPLWFEGGGRPTRNMRDAVAVLSHAADDGLDPADYYPQFVTLTAQSDNEMPTPHDTARADVAASAAMLRYLRDVHMGRVDPRAIGFRLDVPRDQHDFVTLLRDAIREQRIVSLSSGLRPPLAQYRLLRTMLPRYRALAADRSMREVQPVSRPIHPGDLYRDIDTLRSALIAFGDVTSDVPAGLPRYGGSIVEGVKHFQARHGLAADGVLGRSTIARLRTPLAWRVRQIELALERLRWLPHVGERRLIALNIPMFRLWAWNAIPPTGAPLFGMDVIVGRALSTQTPVFAAEMDEVIFRPYWNVPTSIVRHELLRVVHRDPGYLRNEGFEIVSGAGDSAPSVDLTPEAVAALQQGRVRVRQRPGPRNALGLVKFQFPNREDVYMHGTPAQALFARTRRDFSHGCVRVADPVALAEWVLQDRPEWTRDRILATTAGTETLHVKLPRTIQVILFYTTAAVMPDDGTIHFAEDIYAHDGRLDRALDGVHDRRTVTGSRRSTQASIER
jgi:L,D-transpeptidase YcbB